MLKFNYLNKLIKREMTYKFIYFPTYLIFYDNKVSLNFKKKMLKKLDDEIMFVVKEKI